MILGFGVSCFDVGTRTEGCTCFRLLALRFDEPAVVRDAVAAVATVEVLLGLGRRLQEVTVRQVLATFRVIGRGQPNASTFLDVVAVPDERQSSTSGVALLE